MKFSITIPTYKALFLKEAIESVLSQSYSNWELIIVDDCSPDDIESIVKPYITDWPVKYYRNNKNCGAKNVVENWNICLYHCTGDYIICMGDDDKLLPCCLEEYKKLINAHPDLNVYHARAEIINEKNDIIKIQAPRPEWESVLSLIWNRWSYRDKQYIGDFCYKTHYLKEVGGYHELPLAWGSDDITAVKAAQYLGIANTNEFCFAYRENSLSITSSGNARLKLRATIELYKWYENFLNVIKPETLTEQDRIYWQTINNPKQLYYYRSVGQNCVDIMRGNPFRIILCWKATRIFGYTLLTIIRFYLSSLVNIVSRKTK